MNNYPQFRETWDELLKSEPKPLHLRGCLSFEYCEFVETVMSDDFEAAAQLVKSVYAGDALILKNALNEESIQTLKSRAASFGASVAVLDTNVYRVLSRVVHGVEPPSRSALEPLARELLPQLGAPLDTSAWHQCLMDLGATLCRVRAPRCMLCPLRELCQAAPLLQSGDTRRLAEASVPYSPKQGAFTGSTRFYRGKVVDAMRALPPGGVLAMSDLGQVVLSAFTPERDAAWLETLVTGLERDGLLVRTQGGVGLP